MPPRSVPTARQVRLGAELRKLRERAGLTAREAGELISANQARISNIETGRFGLSEQRVRTLAHNYSCADEHLISALVAMTGKQKRGWWEEYRGRLPASLLDLAEHMHHATEVWMANVLHIPGLLQTADYARAVFSEAVPSLPPPDVEHRVSFRIKLQEILYAARPTPFKAVIHEAALRMPFGGPTTTRHQLQHILDMSERADITVLTVPFRSGVFPGSGQSVVYFGGPVPQLDTVLLDQSHGTVLLDAEAQLEKYRLLFDKMEATALEPKRSRDFIHGLIHER
ncbi:MULTISPECIES: helix-turn-helix transcriptional regulator [Streptomyces]|uniref:Helix-turn-helix transcriptional regulator n=1 Tax=Streptomyces mordarskii TaxID=1226758 RepID=A0ABN1DAQ3_9ACTN|nr:helix-turn-helix transcriptional regulator [Streptomyces sp. AgN23]QTI89361.1 helix-turn-helix domain-containing protein [Streptomyces sp. AgN23]WTA84166.1 helix-turn-helix domain-containing protein [Streptomyces antimycoticus]WTB05399.1 helix-turn-helix domain-containing protein [Streptomyces antimycoticus]